MPLVVGIAFTPVSKVYYFAPAAVEDLQPGERVVVETSRGRTLGQVVFAPREVADSEIASPLKPVVTRATAWDLVQQDQMAHREAETLQICRERAAALGLDMKVVRVEWAYDASSIVVYFGAEQRVDFRNLVHDLAQVLHTRVEMRQVGVRDEAKFMSGYGRCGRQLCCASWLREFAPVSIKMAKAQDLPLNSAEVSGLCGRLLCCLSYENSLYAEARKRMPKLNSMLMTPQGPGKVKQINVLRNSVTVQVEGPNETTTLVEVLVLQPSADKGQPDRSCAACLAGLEEVAGMVGDGEEAALDLAEEAPEEAAARPGPEAASEAPQKKEAAAPSQPDSPKRRPRSRRRRR